MATAGGGTLSMTRTEPPGTEGPPWVRRHRKRRRSGGLCLSGRRAYKDTLAESRCKAAPYEGETKGATWKRDQP
jgi:hypothetical protein